MDSWRVTCQSCTREYVVSARDEKEAIKLAEAKHEQDNAERMQLRCDRGPFMTHAFNLTHPTHPAAPKEW